MDGGSLDKTLDRIEIALDRIARAARQRQADASDLGDKHARLKEAVGRSLAQLDELIAGQRE